MIDPQHITGLVLAGGRGSRMGGVDKGLQPHAGLPLVMHALTRLGPQVGQLMINANRNLGAYESFGVPVWPDTVPDYAGPLAGFLVGLEHCETPWLVMNAARLSALLDGSTRTLPPPIDGGVVSTDAMKETDTLASTNIMMFVMMSR